MYNLYHLLAIAGNSNWKVHILGEISQWHLFQSVRVQLQIGVPRSITKIWTNFANTGTPVIMVVCIFYCVLVEFVTNLTYS